MNRKQPIFIRYNTQHSIFKYRQKMGCQMSSVLLSQEPRKLTLRSRKTKLIDSRRRSTMFSDHISQNVLIIRDKLQNQELQFATKCLNEHEFFSTLKDQQISQITRQMVLAEARQESYVFQQGDPGNSFFIIYTGEVEVEIDGVHVRNLTTGKSFGELALLFRTQRTASIKCKAKNCIFLIVKPASLRQSLKKMKIFEFQKNKKMILNVKIFQSLTNKHKQLISQNFKTISFRKGQTIFKEGDPANSFYIISSGQVQLSISQNQPIILKAFQSFGQNAFKQNSRRQGTATAIQQTLCCFLNKSDLDLIFGQGFYNIFYYNRKKWALMGSQNFRNNSYLINNLIGKIQTKQAQEGEVLVESLPTGLIIALSGTINGKPEGSLFCENNFKNRNELCRPIIKDNKGDYGYLPFQIIDSVFKEFDEKKILKNYSKKCLQDKENHEMFNFSEFTFVKELGEGQFGKVYLVRNNSLLGNLYAIKCLSKQAIRKQGMQKCVIQQKQILSKIVFPYIVGFAQAFHDENNIYFLMQYIKGKQMFDVIRQMPTLSRKIATYFFGCLLLAIEHLHQNKIIYRDIKPQNSVIDYTGKVSLVDLGTAKILKKESFYKTFTLIGTPHYMAPETFQANGYSFEADIWSLGVILFEFIFAKLPFGEDDTDPYVVMKKIKNEAIVFLQNSYVHKEAKQVLQLLLEKNPKVRAIKATFQNIKQCSYFSGIDWNSLLQENVQPPYIPKDFQNQKEPKKQNKQNSKKFGQFLYGKSFLNQNWVAHLWNQEFNWK